MKKLLMLSIATITSSLFTLTAQSWLWAKQGRNANKQYNLSGSTSIAIDKFHNVYQTGQYTGDTLIFGSDALIGTSYEEGFETFLVKYDDNGNVLWAQTSKSPAKNNTNSSSQFVITDSRNNVYITGGFEDTLNFQSFSVYAPNNFIHTLLVKYNANGNVKWAMQSTTPNIGYSPAGGDGIAIDKSDNIYLLGSYERSASFGSYSLTGTVTENAFLVKYDTNGNVKWTKQGINCVTGYSVGASVITDNLGYIYITGVFWDTITFGSQTLYNPTLNQLNLFIVKYDSSGNVIWAKQPILPKGKSGSYGNALGKDNSGNIYVTGYFSDTVSFGPYTLINPLYKYKYNTSLFWAKYDNNGNLLYAKQAYDPDTLSWQGFSITTDAQYNLYLTGSQSNNGTKKGKIIFGTDTLQKSKIKGGCVWLKLDSNGSVLNNYIFSGGGGSAKVPTVVDSTGCYVYFGGTTFDTTIVFGIDSVGTYYMTDRPFVARWSDSKCIEGITTIENQNSCTLNLFPNPTNKLLNFNFNRQITGLATLSIMDITGREVMSFVKGSNTTLMQIDVSSLSSGVYLLSFKTKDTNITQKFIKY